MHFVSENINERRARDGIDPGDLLTVNAAMLERAREWIVEGHYQRTRRAIDPAELDRRLAMVRMRGSSFGLLIPVAVQKSTAPESDSDLDWQSFLQTEHYYFPIDHAVRKLDTAECPLAEMDRRRKLHAARKVS